MKLNPLNNQVLKDEIKKKINSSLKDETEKIIKCKKIPK
jgi:flagellar basal body-associated protein FliL